MAIPAPPRQPTYGQGDTMLDLIMQQGNARAQAAQNSGNIWGNAFQNIGNTLAGGIQQYGEQQAVKKRTAALDALFGGPEPPSLGSLVKILGPKDGVDAFKGLRATMPDASKLYGDRMEQARDVARGVQALPEERRAAAYQYARQQLVASGAFKPEEAPEEFNPDFITQLASYGKEEAKPQGLVNVAPGNTVIDPATRQPVYTAPAAPADAPRPMVVGRDLVDPATGRVIHRAAPEPRAPREDNEPLMAVIDPATGRPVYRRRSAAEGLAPASTREQGRPVTSGDAGRITELDTSLDDLKVLRGAVSGSGATGTSARVGAALWNPITEATGIGKEAKAKQAAIDRVKQVIGKALEGGVLRKEDEMKYEKILPTIGDVPEVVEAKLAGLEQAIALRRQRSLESLADAGYDTARFTERPAGAAAPPPPAPPSPAGAGQLPLVNSPAEAARLPRGSQFRTPDGQIRVVP